MVKKFKQFLEEWEPYLDVVKKSDEDENYEEILDSESIAQEEQANEVRK